MAAVGAEAERCHRAMEAERARGPTFSAWAGLWNGSKCSTSQVRSRRLEPPHIDLALMTADSRGESISIAGRSFRGTWRRSSRLRQPLEKRLCMPEISLVRLPLQPVASLREAIASL